MLDFLLRLNLDDADTLHAIELLKEEIKNEPNN